MLRSQGENWFLRSNAVSRHDMRGLGPDDLPTRLVYGEKMKKYVLRRVIFHSGKHGGVITMLSIIDFFWCEAKIAITMDATIEPAHEDISHEHSVLDHIVSRYAHGIKLMHF